MATGRLYAETLSTTTVATPTGRLYAVTLSGSPGIVIDPIDDVTAEPEVPFSITANVSSGGTPTYSWRVISGDGGTLVGSGATVIFTPDSGQPQAVYPPLTRDTVLGVTATVGGVTSAEEIITVHVLPQLEWWWDGTQWKGAKPYRFN